MFRDTGGVLRIVLLVRTQIAAFTAARSACPADAQEREDHDFLATALREAEEEIGLPPDRVDVLAELQPLETVATGWRVYPFLGLVPGELAWRLEPDEVARLLTPSVEMLGDPSRRQHSRSPRAPS